MIVSGLLAATLVFAGPTGPDKGTTAPQRYKVDITLNQAVDLTPMGQGVMDSEITATVYVALTMSDTTGGKVAHMLVDSMTINATGMAAAGFPAEAADSVRGKYIHAYIVDGKIKGNPVPSVEGNPALGLAASALPALFVGVPAGKKIGDTWSDTTNTTPPADGSPGMSGEAIVEWTVTGMDGAALVLTGSQKGTVSGEPQPGQQVSGTITGTNAVTTVPGGPSTRASVSTEQKLEVLVAAAPDVIRVDVKTTAQVSALP